MKVLLLIPVLFFAGCSTYCPALKVQRTAMSDWRTLAKQHPAPQDVNIHRIDVSRSTAESHHIVQIRDREKRHAHDHHDLTIFVLEGRGSLLLGDEEIPCVPGTVVTIPRGTPHAFINGTKQLATAYAIFRPGFDGKDVRPIAQP